MRRLARLLTAGLLALSCITITLHPVHAGVLGAPDVPNFYTFAVYLGVGVTGGGGPFYVDGAESDNVPSQAEASTYWYSHPMAQAYVTAPITGEDLLGEPVASGILFDEMGNPK